MKYYFLLILSAFFISCSDESDPIVVQTDEDIVQYLTQNNIATVKSNTGLRYSIVNNGNGKFPTENAKVTLSYKASLLDGTVFEESNEEGITLLLHNLIPGLKEGLQYFDEGSEGLIFIPPALGFGNFTRNGVPAGSVLIFEIKILKVIEAEDEILQYLSEKDLTAEKSASGLYYIISKQGEGKPALSSSNVTVSYKGYFTNGTVFDQSTATGVSFNLQQVIDGWKEGITYFNEGGEGILLIPPHLGYGYTDRTGIPAGSVLIFEIKLISVN